MTEASLSLENKKLFWIIAVAVLVIIVVGIFGFRWGVSVAGRSAAVQQETLAIPTIIGNVVPRPIVTEDEVNELNWYSERGMLAIETPRGLKDIPREALLKLTFAGFMPVDFLDSTVGVHPEDPNRVLFIASASKNDTPPIQVTNVLFQYNLETGSIEEVYRDEKSGLRWRTLGSVGSKVLVRKEDLDFSPGPCFSPWIDGEIEHIELADIQKGLQPYAKLGDKISIEAEEQMFCKLDGGLK